LIGINRKRSTPQAWWI